jgi:hypothetical protein
VYYPYKRIKSDSTSWAIFCKRQMTQKSVQLVPQFMRALYIFGVTLLRLVVLILFSGIVGCSSYQPIVGYPEN